MEETGEKSAKKGFPFLRTWNSLLSLNSLLCYFKVVLFQASNLWNFFNITGLSQVQYSQHTTCTRSVSSILVKFFYFSALDHILHFPLPLSIFLWSALICHGSCPQHHLSMVQSPSFQLLPGSCLSPPLSVFPSLSPPLSQSPSSSDPPTPFHSLSSFHLPFSNYRTIDFQT